MATEPKSRRRKRKKIVKKNNGALFDASERRRITMDELREYVRDGGLFEARRHESGADCTYEVLQSVMGAGFLQNLVPGVGGGSIPGLSGLAELARVLGGEGDRGGWEDWDEPKRPRRTGEHRWDNPDFAEPPGGTLPT